MSIVRAAILRRASGNKLYADNGYAGIGGLRPHLGLRQYKVSRVVLERSRDKNVLPRLALKYYVGRRCADELNKRAFVAVVNNRDVVGGKVAIRAKVASSVRLCCVTFAAFSTTLPLLLCVTPSTVVEAVRATVSCPMC